MTLLYTGFWEIKVKELWWGGDTYITGMNTIIAGVQITEIDTIKLETV